MISVDKLKVEFGATPLFQDVFGKTLVELARQNPRIVGVTPAMSTGCSMNLLMESMPERAFDVGIAEGHAATFSGGMAKEGLQPFCNIYSSFMQRAYDNVIHDIALLRLPVVLCLDRAGLVGEDGPTHHGVFDLAYFRPIPNLTIASPLDEHELRRLMYTAQLPDKGPFVIRYPRGRGVLVDWHCPFEEIPVGKGRRLKDGTDVVVISLGPIGNLAARAIGRVEREQGLSVAHYDLRFLKPLDEDLLHEVGRRFSRLVTVEDGVLKGGMGSAVLEFMADCGYAPRVCRVGVPDRFVDTDRDGWHFDPSADRTVPIILPRSYLAIYNFGFAQSRSLPKLSEGVIGMVDLAIHLRGNGHEEIMKGRVIGFSNRLNTILVPESFMEWSNRTFAPEADTAPTRLIVEVDNPTDDAIARFLQEKGYETDSDKLDAGRTTYFLKVVSGVMLCVGLLISALSFYILMLSIYLLVQKNTTKLENLLLIGYSPWRVGMPYQALTVGMNLLVLMLALGFLSLLRGFYIDTISVLFPQMEDAGMWPALALGIVLCLLVSVLNVCAIHAKVLAIWKHKG